MRTLSEIEQAIQDVRAEPDASDAANELLRLSDEILEHWITAHEMEPTYETREGFRLLALHRQGATGNPSFNACRETCREVAYYYNLVSLDPEHAECTNRIEMMKMISSHLFYFVSGKLQVAELGEFCCSSKPIRMSA
jgi:hypothetical protein